MTESAEADKKFAIQKLYVKDVSYESPSTPQAFVFKQWNPKIDMNLTNKHTLVEGDVYEVVMSVTVTATQDENTTFLIEVQQAGLFEIAGFDEDQKKYLLGSQCMNILFPYAREMISDMSMRGGFPPLIMSPVNFDVLYQQHLQKQQADKSESGATH